MKIKLSKTAVRQYIRILQELENADLSSDSIELALCVYNSETTPPNNLESRAEEQMRCLRTQMVR